MIKLFYITAEFFREILFASPTYTLIVNVPERWKVCRQGELRRILKENVVVECKKKKCSEGE